MSGLDRAFRKSKWRRVGFEITMRFSFLWGTFHMQTTDNGYIYPSDRREFLFRRLDKYSTRGHF